MVGPSPTCLWEQGLVGMRRRARTEGWSAKAGSLDRDPDQDPPRWQGCGLGAAAEGVHLERGIRAGRNALDPPAPQRHGLQGSTLKARSAITQKSDKHGDDLGFTWAETVESFRDSVMTGRNQIRADFNLAG